MSSAESSVGDDPCSSGEEDGERGLVVVDKHAARMALNAAIERAEGAEALKRLQSMPTWRAIRGKGAGKGACKLEWGTRLIIYSLLGMMVPASAIGAVIVAIVRRTAPWLSPTAPTYECVQRCRFELRFVEEALAARRIAGAYRVRGIGFDETTKLGNSSFTSNVTIEVTPGARLEDVICRAAYCPLGGTAELCVRSIELKCFSRMRLLLQQWKAQFELMFPAEQWTGPDGVHMLARTAMPCLRGCCCSLIVCSCACSDVVLVASPRRWWRHNERHMFNGTAS